MSNSNLSKSELLQEINRLKSELASLKRTTEKRTEELLENEQRFVLAMRGANDGLWDWNLETNEVYYSPRWKSMLGYEENELEGTLDTWASLVHPDDKEWVLDKVQDYLEGRADSFEVEMRMRHRNGKNIFVLSRGFLVVREVDNKPFRMVGTHVDITERKKAEALNISHAEILEMIAIGHPTSEIYDAIALMYEKRHPGMRCSMLELHGNKLLHGGAPSLPKEYCEALNGLEFGSNVGSCGTSTFTGERVLVEDISADPKWEKIKELALPHGLRSCWSEPIKSSSGKVLGAFGMYYDFPALPNEEELNDLKSAARLSGIVMEREQTQKKIRELAYTDELTGLSSRARFYMHLKELIKASLRRNHRFGLLYIDLDDFKGVNDSLGHDTGDLLLKEIGDRLASTCRDVDFVARLSGDEFCVLVEEISDDYNAASVAQRCLESIGQPVEFDSRKLIPACSIGIAHFPDDGADLSTLLKAADTSLYEAKEKGKNQFAFYKPELTQRAEYQFQVEKYLREAIEKRQLSLVYQPQVNISTGKITGVEALSRWHHPELGQVPPAEFIAIAEKIGMIKKLTEWVLMTACRQALAWRERGFADLRIAINIPPSQLAEEDFVPAIKNIIGETGISSSDLELEVTENIVQTGQENLSVIKDLKARGILFAIDDFGTGYSSLASLKHLEVDCLKIDNNFINGMLEDNDILAIVEFMIEFGKKLGYEVIAEGVESVEQLDTLKKLGCETVQGYLFSEPVSGDEIDKLLTQKKVGLK
ncbi:bifunctional diguanylate cyclase/phosphodiesterase [Aliikangiella coralliicola]|uniref:EAL domain-containing protein n=1 Tax=Aliikangiella coralliicola TaxID=2592383 RepID=A0A545UIX3_9GAMM|nr:EAL domain-containing protein [Aliikangiella coralliicola]TQV89415.1 EAL domain-containing protein [Aliikangiella coralliicola]